MNNVTTSKVAVIAGSKLDYLRRKYKLHEMDCVLIPFVKNSHWTLFILEGIAQVFREMLAFYLALDEKYRDAAGDIPKQALGSRSKWAGAGDGAKPSMEANTQQISLSESSKSIIILNSRKSSGNLIEIVSKKDSVGTDSAVIDGGEPSPADSGFLGRKRLPESSPWSAKRFSNTNLLDFEDFSEISQNLEEPQISIIKAKKNSTQTPKPQKHNTLEIHPKIEYLRVEKRSDAPCDRVRIDSLPPVKSKIGIFHLDSMSSCESRRRYRVVAKMFKHILNFLLTKEINQRLRHCRLEHPVRASAEPVVKLEEFVREQSPSVRAERFQDESAGLMEEADSQAVSEKERIEESKARRKLVSGANCVLESVEVPQQKNGSDCGVCVLENIERVLFNKDCLNKFKSSSEHKGN